MEKKSVYVSPESEALSVLHEGIICESEKKNEGEGYPGWE